MAEPKNGSFPIEFRRVKKIYVLSSLSCKFAEKRHFAKDKKYILNILKVPFLEI